MSEHIIDIPANTEVVITIAINPCSKCDPVEVPTLPDPVVEPIPIPVIEPVPVSEPIPTPTTEPQNDPPVVNTPPEVEPTTPIAETPVPETAPVTPDPIVTTEPIPIVEVPEVSPPPEVKPIEPPTVENPTTPPIPIMPEISPPPITTPEVPPVETIPLVIPPLPPAPTPEASCDCKLTSTLSLAEFTKQLITAAKDLIYPSESESPIEVLSKGLNTRMPPIKGIEVRTLDRVLPSFLRQVDPDDQQTGNEERAAIAARWQALYDLISKHTATTAWHYPVKQKRYTHEELVVMLHPQGTIGLRIRLVET